MTIQSTIKQLRPAWHKNTPLDAFGPIEDIEAAYGCPLPADLKYFYQWFSDGGEGRLPGGYLHLYSARDLLEIQDQYAVRRLLGNLLVIGDDGDEAFALDLTKRRDTGRYPVVQFSFASMDRDEVEQVADDFEDFLLRRLNPRAV